MSKPAKQQPEELADVPVAPETLPTAQQDVPLPLMTGERKLATRWITGILEWHTYPAPTSGGKKG